LGDISSRSLQIKTLSFDKPKHFINLGVKILMVKILGVGMLLVLCTGCYSNNVYAVEDHKCGTMGKAVLEIPKRFVLAWEQERDLFLLGKSDPEGESRCDEDTVSLTIGMTWPAKEFVDAASYKKGVPKFAVVEVTLMPWNKPNNELGPRFRVLIEAAKKQSKSPVSYANELGMYFVDGLDTASPLVQRAYYWQEREGEIFTVFECTWSIQSKIFILCSGTFAVEEMGVLVGTQFSADKLWRWKEIEIATRDLILSRVKKG
jgi:hypothetical protein